MRERPALVGCVKDAPDAGRIYIHGIDPCIAQIGARVGHVSIYLRIMQGTRSNRETPATFRLFQKSFFFADRRPLLRTHNQHCAFIFSPGLG